MIGRLEREDVRHLVPQRAAPVKLAGGAPGRTVHRHHITERHAEQADAGQTGDPHGEVVVIRIEFERHRLTQREAITARELIDALLRQLQQVRTQRRRLLGVQPQADFERFAAHDDVRTRQFELVDAIEQAQGIRLSSGCTDRPSTLW